MAKSGADLAPAGLTHEAILDFISKNPSKATKRDIARAFALKGSARIALKRMLRELADEGLIEKSQRMLVEKGGLPPVFVAEIVDVDSAGELIIEPAETIGEGNNRHILLTSKRSRIDLPGIGDRVLVRRQEGDSGSDELPTVRAIKRIEKSAQNILAVVQNINAPVRLEPIDRKQREMIAASPPGDLQVGELVAVELKPGRALGPKPAKIIQRHGLVGNEKAVSLIAIHAHDIPHVFPQKVHDEAAEAADLPLGKREDWTHFPLVTIDPPDAKDHDDAVCALPDDDPQNPGGFIILVAIADVSHYVPEGSALDQEAKRRGNSVYFPDQVVPMLPETLSNGICSLKEGETRPAITARMIFDAQGKKKSHSFHRITMRSHAFLSYAEAQEKFDGQKQDRDDGQDLDTSLQDLWAGYQCLKKGRNHRAPLELDLPERKLKLDSNGKVETVYSPDRLEAHKLIEEFMIQANVAAAEALSNKKMTAIYRIHDGPSEEKLAGLKETLASLDIRFNPASVKRARDLNILLTKVTEKEAGNLISEMVLRSQSQAEYSIENIGHFGLTLKKYAHFTSPIRRYADLTIHRALNALIDGSSSNISASDEALAAIAASISKAERSAAAAERDTIDRLIAGFLSTSIGAHFKGRISGTAKAGLFIRLDETGADGFIPASTLGDEYFVYDAAGLQLIGENTGTSYRIADRVEVRLVEAAPIKGALRFEMISQGVKRQLSRKTVKRGGKGRFPKQASNSKSKYRKRKNG